MATINKILLQQLRSEINAAVEAVRAKHGLTRLEATNCSFTPDGAFTFKLEGIVAGGTSKEGTLYRELQSALRLPDLGFEFSNAGERYRTAGLNTSATKVYCTRVRDAKVFAFKIDALLSIVKRQKAVAA